MAILSVVALMFSVALAACADDSDTATGGLQVPEIQAICAWVDELDGPATTGEVNAERLDEIGQDAGRMAAWGRTLRLPTGEGAAALANASELLEFIRDAAQDESGLMSIPTYRQILGDRLGTLVQVMQEIYSLSPREAPCAGRTPA